MSSPLHDETAPPPSPVVTPGGDGVFPVVQVARCIGLTVPPACMNDVAANAALLQGYADLLNGFALPDTCEPAGEYVP
ncbi:DUF4089 domain-containing protein [Novacetimonas pomaceti]|uniref:DUF4089 domain-containing protein n=1 Tax=Novacetimonas pomaceti TaxID=2021998 RepID=A0ABX5P4J3_9PROT|nr:DUF4089 domain-containing protein [Novacetimonas pomaceti]PYD48665.1 DUF4089 domain-containing protein [Novacetimonas pomaceti]